MKEAALSMAANRDGKKDEDEQYSPFTGLQKAAVRGGPVFQRSRN